MYRKPVYSTSVQKTSSKYKCTERNVQGQTLHINLYCTTIEYHTDGTSYLIRNVQGQTCIKDNFNFVNDRQSDIVDYRAAYFAAKKAQALKIIDFYN